MNRYIIQETIQGSLNSALTFPQIVGKLTADGVEAYHVDLVRNEGRYYAADGACIVEPIPVQHAPAAAEFSAKGVADAVKSSQTGKINYTKFVELISAAGANYYVVYLTGKRVIYFGRKGNSHTEFFPK